MKKMLERFQEPKFLKAFHGWSTLVWFILSLPLALLFGDLVVFVTFLSLYAIVVSHWAAWGSARGEVEIIAQNNNEVNINVED
jgi:hypothetical protein